LCVPCTEKSVLIEAVEFVKQRFENPCVQFNPVT
jgi:hypothetical protein